MQANALPPDSAEFSSLPEKRLLSAAPFPCDPLSHNEYRPLYRRKPDYFIISLIVITAQLFQPICKFSVYHFNSPSSSLKRISMPIPASSLTASFIAIDHSYEFPIALNSSIFLCRQIFFSTIFIFITYILSWKQHFPLFIHSLKHLYSALSRQTLPHTQRSTLSLRSALTVRHWHTAPHTPPAHSDTL